MSTVELSPVTSGRLVDILFALWPLTTRGVISATTVATPASPADGDAYVVPASGVTGQWANKAEADAILESGGGLRAMFSAALRGWTTVDPTEAQPGDLALVETALGESCGVVVQPGWLDARAPEGVEFVEAKAAREIRRAAR